MRGVTREVTHLRLTLPLALFATLLLAPLAVAQGPVPQPSATLTVSGLEGTITGIEEGNTTKDIPVTVSYAIGNTVCPPGGAVVAITGTLTPKLTPAGSFFTATLEPAEVPVTFAQGPNPPSQTATFTIKLAILAVPVNTSVQLDFTADAPAAGCTPAPPDPPAVMASGFANMTAPPPPPPTPEPVAESPGFEVVLAVGAALGVAVAMRRKRAP